MMPSKPSAVSRRFNFVFDPEKAQRPQKPACRDRPLVKIMQERPGELPSKAGTLACSHSCSTFILHIRGRSHSDQEKGKEYWQCGEERSCMEEYLLLLYTV